LFLAAINRRLLIDSSDPLLDRAAEQWLREQQIRAHVHSLMLDDDSAILFVRADEDVVESFAIGEALKDHLRKANGKTANGVYWKFPKAARTGHAAAGA
jgi:hypothetical protein